MILSANTAKYTYDSANGLNISNLSRDTEIPVIQKVSGADWTPLHTASGQEAVLADILKNRNIPVYYPVLKDAVPFFEGIVFAALSPENKQKIRTCTWIEKIKNLNESEVFADLVFMTMAEQISRFYSFTFEGEMPEKHSSAETVMPLKKDGFGDCRIISNRETGNTQMYFHFKSVEKILKFDLSLCQFRSLLLSNLLFTTKYSA